MKNRKTLVIEVQFLAGSCMPLKVALLNLELNREEVQLLQFLSEGIGVPENLQGQIVEDLAGSPFTTVGGKWSVVGGDGLVVGEKDSSKSIENLSKHELERLIKRLSKIKKKKYLRNKDRK